MLYSLNSSMLIECIQTRDGEKIPEQCFRNCSERTVVPRSCLQFMEEYISQLRGTSYFVYVPVLWCGLCVISEVCTSDNDNKCDKAN